MQPWWRHQVGLFSALLALCAGNSSVPVNSPHKGQWRGALMFSLICAWINDWVNNREAGDFRHHRGHYDVIVLIFVCIVLNRSHNVLIKHLWKFVFTSPIESELTCVQVISHYLNRGWHSSLTYICTILLQLFNIAVICSWWRHQMETFFALLALCAGNSSVTGELSAQRPVTWSLDVFFDLRLNKRLNK